MGTWFLILGSNLLIPVIMLLAGKVFVKSAPKKINWILGYRTTMSMKNQDTWQFAHTVAGKFWFRWGWVNLAVAVIPMLFALGKTESVMANVSLAVMVTQLIPLIAVIPYTEKALCNTFDQEGNRKTGF